MKRFMLSLLIISALAGLGAAFAANKPTEASAPDPWKQNVTVDFVNVPLTKAIAVMLKGASVSYTISPGLEGALVTAKLSNMPLDLAFKQVVRAAGATISQDNGTMVISGGFGGMGGGGGRATPGATNQGAMVVKTFKLTYVEPADILPILQANFDLQLVQFTLDKSIIARGTEQDLQRLAATIVALDRPESLPRAVKIQLKIAVTTSKQGGKPAPSTNFTTLSIGAEGIPQSLEITAEGRPESPQDVAQSMNAQVSLTPTIVSEGGKETISVTGAGAILGYVEMEFSKSFDVAATVVPGQETVIAGGSADANGYSMSFTISALATIEGRVKLPYAKDEQSGDPIKLIKAKEALDEAKVEYDKANQDLAITQKRYGAGYPTSDLADKEAAVKLAQIHLNAAQQLYDAEQQKSGGFGGGMGGGAGGRGGVPGDAPTGAGGGAGGH